MLVQHRHDGRLRLVRQHDHALVAGELAGVWRGLDREPAFLSFDLVIATALHDIAWRELDAEPRLDPATGLPYAFHDFPLAEKLVAYARGLDAVSRIHPFAAFLGSLHYASFPDVAEADDFVRAEERRRRELATQLRLEPEDEWRLGRQLAFLQLFDTLSIFLCLAPPSAAVEAQPPWVDEARHLAVPGGGTFHLTWVDDEVVHVDPYPFRETLELRIPYREVEPSRFDGQEELSRAWAEAPERDWWVEVREPLRLA